MTNVEALKQVYTALGGSADDFTAQTNDEAISQIAAVAGSGSGDESILIDVNVTGIAPNFTATTTISKDDFLDALKNHPDKVLIRIKYNTNYTYIRDIWAYQNYGMNGIFGGCICMAESTAQADENRLSFQAVKLLCSNSDNTVSVRYAIWNMNGSIPVAGANNNGKVMTVVDGKWAAAALPST